MWTIGTLLRLEESVGGYVKPRRSFKRAHLCLIIHGIQKSFGTKGALNEYLLLNDDCTLMTIALNDHNVKTLGIEVLKEFV